MMDNLGEKSYSEPGLWYENFSVKKIHFVFIQCLENSTFRYFQISTVNGEKTY